MGTMVNPLKSSGLRRLGIATAQEPPLNQERYTDGHSSRQHLTPWQQRQQHTSAHQNEEAQEQNTGRDSISCSKTSNSLFPRRDSKLQALSAFRSAVQGAAAPARIGMCKELRGPASTNAAQTASKPTLTNVQAPSVTRNPSIPTQGRQALAAPAAQGAAQPKPIRPERMLHEIDQALQALTQQLYSRTLTYLYQFDRLLSTASDMLAALVTHLCSTGTPTNQALLQLMQGNPTMNHDASEDLKAVLGTLLQLCMQTWVSLSFTSGSHCCQGLQQPAVMQQRCAAVHTSFSSSSLVQDKWLHPVHTAA